MSEITEKNNRGVDAGATVARLFVLELNAGRIHSMNTDGTERETIVTGCHLPDGIVVDIDAGHIYWTNMGVPNLNDGSIERADIDGKNRKTIFPRDGPTRQSRSSSISETKALLVRSRGHARHALQSRRFAAGDTDRIRPRRSRPPGSDTVVRRTDDRREARTYLLVAKRAGQCRSRSHLPRQY
jgi:hypothetical protein